MAEKKRVSLTSPNNKKIIGPRLAKVVGHTDPTYMGGLQVTLVGPDGDAVAVDSQTITVRYCPPFFGATNLGYNGLNKGNDNAYNDTQKSYGFSFVPPDIGVTVLCIFLEETGEGFWVGCVPDEYINHMVPAIAASKATDMSATQKTDYGSEPLPVADVNKVANDLKTNNDLDAVKKPVHPIAGFMLEEGLLYDDIRGRTTSTMRRNQTPSVYGILTPGPLDKRPNAKSAIVGTDKGKTKKPVPVSRVGGTQFVMDDGDDRFQRKTPASEGPPEYASVEKGESGDPRIPISEYFRVRTRTGHQILLHNSEDLIYIGNSRGTAWIELTSDGKIDIFAADSISVHTQGDFNFRADRDINLEAKRNINIRTVEGDYRQDIGKDFLSFVAGDSERNVEGNDLRLVTGNAVDSITGNIELKTSADYKLKAVNGHVVVTNYHHKASANSNFISGGKHIEEANKIEMNCDPATPPTEPASANAAIASQKLTYHENPVVDASLVFKDTRYQSDEVLESIMKRIPMHEPWYQHENVDPQKVKWDKTDREV